MANPRTRNTVAGFAVAALVVALALAAFVSPYASSEPDGLERVADQRGFLDTARDSAAADSPLADYAVRNIDDAKVSTGLAGIIGVFLTLTVAALVFGGLRFFVRRRRSSLPPPATAA